MKKESTNALFLTLTIFTGFLFFGFSENIKGPAIPLIQSEFSLGELGLGMLLALNSLGYMLACAFTAAFARRAGLKIAISVSLGSMALSGVLIGLSRSLPFFTASYFLMYIGNGMLEITLGVLAARIFVKNTGTMMSLSHFFYGLSSSVAPLLATGLMSLPVGGSGLGWRGMYAVVLISCLVPILFALPGRFPTVEAESAKSGERKRMTLVEYIKNPVLRSVVLILSLGVVGEMGAGGWFVNYLEKSLSYTNADAAFLLMIFFIAFTAARLLLGPVIDRVGLVRSLILFPLCAGLLICGGVLLGLGGVWLIALAGAGVAVIYPTVMAMLARLFPEDIDVVMTVTLTVMGVLMVVGNFLVGAVVDLFRVIFTSFAGAAQGGRLGYAAGFFFLGCCALACAGFTLSLYRRLKKKGELV